MKASNLERATKIWGSLNDSERFGVQFGMFPAGKMPDDLDKDDNHEVVVAMMKLSSERGCK